MLCSVHKSMNTLRVSHPKIGFLNRVIPVISVVLRETTLTISVSTVEPVSVESELIRGVSHSITEISELTRLKIKSSG